MWHEGSIKVKDDIFHYWVKSYEEPSSIYGIDGGRISKAELKRNGEWVMRYERGWDIKPADENTEIALAILMKEFN